VCNYSLFYDNTYTVIEEVAIIIIRDTHGEGGVTQCVMGSLCVKISVLWQKGLKDT